MSSQLYCDALSYLCAGRVEYVLGMTIYSTRLSHVLTKADDQGYKKLAAYLVGQLVR